MRQTITPQAAKAQGFTIDETCYPWFAYKGARFAPDEAQWCYTALEAGQLTAAAFRERSDVLAFHQKFAVPMASSPQFLLEEAFRFRLKFLQEELDEFERDHVAGDMQGAADALVDLVYVAHGTALMMGLPWPRLWAEVQRANMAKVRAKHAGESKRGSALDVVKPADWTPPDHTAALGGVGPWGVFDHRAEGDRK